MNNESKTPTAKEVEMIERLTRNIERSKHRNESLVKSGMANMASDFNGNFEWASEQIYKGNLILEFITEVEKLISDRECNLHGLRCYLRRTATSAAGTILRQDPYCNSSNGAAALVYRWTYETNKDIYHMANDLLNDITPDE